MNKRLIIKVVFLFFVSLLFSACATTPHKVNIKAIEANKNKMFKLGIVKVEGRMPILGGDNVGKKIMALEKIPIKEICDILSSSYGLQINTEINKTVKTVKEQMSLLSENPYWGNKEYRQTGSLEFMLTNKDTIIQDGDVGDVVYITYGYITVGLPWALKDKFYYEIIVKSDATVLIDNKGTIAVVDIPKKGFILDSEGVWNNLVSYTDKITEALAKNINKAK